MYFAQNKHDDTEQVEGYKVEFFAWIANRNVLLLFCTIFDLQTYNSVALWQGKNYNICKTKGKINYTRTLVETIHNHSWNVSLEVT